LGITHQFRVNLGFNHTVISFIGPPLYSIEFANRRLVLGERQPTNFARGNLVTIVKLIVAI
tara:strand:- start:273 stop:455 length:183 start_codon:yes stop_codon:yes gene_type:complete